MLAVGREELRDRFTSAGETLSICLGGDAENVRGGGAVDLEHGSEHVGASAVGVEALQHDVGAGELELAFEQALIDALGMIGHVECPLVADVGTVHLETERRVGEHMGAAVFQMIHGNAVDPG